MVDFDERDLVTFAERAGFTEVHVQLSIDIEPAQARAWTTLVNSSGNPRVPTLGEAMGQALTADEAERLTSHLRPLVENGIGQRRSAVAYLWALRPRSPGEVD